MEPERRNPFRLVFFNDYLFPIGELETKFDAGGETAFFALDAGGEGETGLLNEAELAEDVAFRIEA